MEISYEINLPGKEEFFELFETTGWNENYSLTADELYIALENSWYLISAYDANRLVGFGRMIADGIVHALIVDMIIHPEYQGEGIGMKILDMLVEKCKLAGIRDVQLFSARDKYGFYEKYGFTRRPESAPGMEIKFKKVGNNFFKITNK